MNSQTPVTGGVAWGFESGSVTVALDALVAMKPLRPDVKMSAKYRQIVTSIKAVGLVEPPVVIPAADQPGVYYLLDGHLRVEALRDLGETTVSCLVSRDDEAFTYNKRVNRLSAPQEHRMIARAIERGVSEARLAEALSAAAPSRNNCADRAHLGAWRHSVGSDAAARYPPAGTVRLAARDTACGPPTCGEFVPALVGTADPVSWIECGRGAHTGAAISNWSSRAWWCVSAAGPSQIPWRR